MPITDLTGYTWLGNNSLDLTNVNYETFNINFTSNSFTLHSLYFHDSSKDTYMYYYTGYDTNGDQKPAYQVSLGGWTNSTYKTIQITGGTDATNSTLIAWLGENGTLTAPAPTPTGVNKLKIGGKTVIKKMIGNKEVIKEVVNGIVVYEKSSAPSGYSGNITAIALVGQVNMPYKTAIKFDTAPSSNNDYDSYVDIDGIILGLTSYSNKTKLYIWSPNAVGSAITINGNLYSYQSVSYSSAVEIQLTGDYNITMHFANFKD